MGELPLEKSNMEEMMEEIVEFYDGPATQRNHQASTTKHAKQEKSIINSKTVAKLHENQPMS